MIPLRTYIITYKLDAYRVELINEVKFLALKVEQVALTTYCPAYQNFEERYFRLSPLEAIEITPPEIEGEIMPIHPMYYLQDERRLKTMKYCPENNETATRLLIANVMLNSFLEWFIDSQDCELTLDCPSRLKIHSHLAIEEVINLWLDSVNWEEAYTNYLTERIGY